MYKVINIQICFNSPEIVVTLQRTYVSFAHSVLSRLMEQLSRRQWFPVITTVYIVNIHPEKRCNRLRHRGANLVKISIKTCVRSS